MKNIFVIGLNEINRQRLQRLRGVDDITFHGVIDPSRVYEMEDYDIPAMLAEAEATLSAFDGTIDAIVGYMDFPVSTMLPILCRKFGVRATSLESLLKCEHKYWSRTVQREVIPDHIPGFTWFDPFDESALARIGEAGMSFPFFVKPIKSSGSRLAFRIDSPEDFDFAIGRLREGIASVAESFDFVLDHADLPEEIRAVSGRCCMAEQVIGGRQCTLEGYVYEGDVVPYGIVDSIRYPQVLSFFYYLYPSQLPQRVQKKMGDLARTVMSHVGYDNSAFNIEFFWDEVQDRIWLLEINTRVAQSHCDLFEKVDGLSHQQVTIDLGLGRRPVMPHREGAYNVGAEFFYRVFFADATVTRVPTAEEVAAAAAKVPGTFIAPQVTEGMRLSDLPEQDSYSYAVACIWMGANKQSTLLWNYDRVLKGLDFEFAEIDG
ncbi:ATP-grasp domain-containing protein [Fodinicurvata sp. EGI_FJ10296]|uniref:ATP-grasp domain-containing protein n=1 Tax=Fodinicurvata sp. EGI_FJ10296 TaxID=3231908 RepID=UPI003454EB91